jgi:hypothetical protein
LDLRFSEAATEAAYCRHRAADPANAWPMLLVLLQGVSQVTAVVAWTMRGRCFRDFGGFLQG